MGKVTDSVKLECARDCHNKHPHQHPQMGQCYAKCLDRHSSDIPRTHSQVSEELAGIASNLYNESAKLSLTVDEMQLMSL